MLVSKKNVPARTMLRALYSMLLTIIPRSIPMKHSQYVAAVLLVLFAFTGCAQSEWEETTLTITNENPTEITLVQVHNGDLGSRVSMSYNVLEAGETLSQGDSVTIPLAPVLHEYSEAAVRITAGTWYDFSLTYGEGAEVKILFDLGETTCTGGDLQPMAF